MNRSRLVILGLAAVAAVVAALLVRGLVGGGTEKSAAATAPQAAATVRVLVAAAAIQPGVKLTPQLVRWQAWPQSALDPTYITARRGSDIGKVIEGAVARAPLVENQPVTTTEIVHADSAGFMAAQLSRGMRAVSIGIDVKSGAGGFILPNDRVDVLLTRAAQGQKGAFATDTILSDVRVLAVDQTYGETKDNKKAVIGKTATLELTPSQAELIAREARAGVLSLSLRPLADNRRRGRDHARQGRFHHPLRRARAHRVRGSEAMRGLSFAVSLAIAAILSTGAGAAGGRGRLGAARDHGLDRAPAVRPISASRSALDKAAIVQLDAPARDVLVSNPDIVDAVVRTPRRIFLLAKKVGQTNAFFFDGGGHQLLSIDITRRARRHRSRAHAQHRHARRAHQGRRAQRQYRAHRRSRQRPGFHAAPRIWPAASSAIPRRSSTCCQIGGGEQVMLKVRIAEVQRQVAKQLGIDLAGAADRRRRADRRVDLQSLRPCRQGAQRSVWRAGRSGLRDPAAPPATPFNGGGTCAIKNNVQGTLQGAGDGWSCAHTGRTQSDRGFRRDRQIPRRRRISGAGRPRYQRQCLRRVQEFRRRPVVHARWSSARTGFRCRSPPRSAN